MTRSPAEAINIMPQVANNRSELNSPPGKSSALIQTVEIKIVRIDTITKMTVKLRRSSSSTIIPPKASFVPGQLSHSQIEATPAASRARIDKPAVLEL